MSSRPILSLSKESGGILHDPEVGRFLDFGTHRLVHPFARNDTRYLLRAIGDFEFHGGGIAGGVGSHDLELVFPV